MRILIDLDGVLADWELAFLETFRARFPHEPFVPLDQRLTFYAVEQYPPELRAACREIYLAPGFYRHLAPIAGGREAMETMTALGHEVVLCSSPLGEFTHCVLEKYQWVDHHLGRFYTDRLILTRDKTLVRGDVLIDDKPSITGAATPVWEHILYDQAYNRAIRERRRLTWSTWRAVLLGDA